MRALVGACTAEQEVRARLATHHRIEFPVSIMIYEDTCYMEFLRKHTNTNQDLASGGSPEIFVMKSQFYLYFSNYLICINTDDKHAHFERMLTAI